MQLQLHPLKRRSETADTRRSQSWPSTTQDSVQQGKDYVPHMSTIQSENTDHEYSLSSSWKVNETTMILFCLLSLHQSPTGSQLTNTATLTQISAAKTQGHSSTLHVLCDLAGTDFGSSLGLWPSGKWLQLLNLFTMATSCASIMQC